MEVTVEKYGLKYCVEIAITDDIIYQLIPIESEAIAELNKEIIKEMLGVVCAGKPQANESSNCNKTHVMKSVCECADRHEDGIVWSAKTGRYIECKCKQTVL